MEKHLDHTIKDVRDAAKEGAHKGNAEIEREKRSEHGDVMTPGDKANSMAREVSEDAKAAFDRGKREMRDAT